MTIFDNLINRVKNNLSELANCPGVMMIKAGHKEPFKANLWIMRRLKNNNLIKLINKILLWFPAGTWLELIQVIQQSVLLQ